MLKRTGLASLAAALTLGVTVVVGGAGSVAAEASEPYQILVRPADAQNPLNTDHQFTVEVRTDSDGDGSVDDPVIGVEVNLRWVGPAGSVILANATTSASDPFGVADCVTISSPTEPNGGICAVDIRTPDDVGTGTLTASFSIADASPDVDELPSADQGTTCSGAYVPGPIIASCTEWVDVQRIEVRGDHTWVGYVVDVEPDAVLPVGLAHTFDIFADRTDGATAVPAADIIANFSWMNGPSGSAVTEVNGAPLPDGTTCTTSGVGTCTVTVTSPVPGSGSLRLDSLVGALIGGQPKIESPTPSSDRLAEATWVDWRVLITPLTATNLSGDAHVFTLSLETDDGTGWVNEGEGNTISTTWNGPVGSSITGVSAGTVDSPTAATCETDLDGQCTVTVNSTTSGAGVLTATEVAVSLPDYVAPGDEGAGGSFEFDIVDGEGAKTWIEFFAAVSPSATNLAGDPHAFTIDATYDDGTGTADVPDGTAVAFTWVGDGAANPVASCIINAGACDVVVSADDAGAGTLTVTSVTALINDTQFTAATVAAADGARIDASKTWIELLAAVSPTATNLVGDQHVFTIEATADDGTEIAPVPDGSTIFYSWAGAGAASPTSSCTALAGSCEVTVTSGDTGVGTISIVSITTAIGSSTFTEAVPAAASDGALAATKTWVDYRIDVTPPTDQNLVENEHVFTVLIERDAGDGFVPFAGAVPAIELVGVGAIGDETCSNGTNAVGTCTVVGVSELPGDMTVTATLTRQEAGPASLTISDSGDKLWVDYRLTLTPKQAINKVTEAHVFVAKLEVDRGDGFAVAKNETLDIGATGIGAIINIDAAGKGANTCVTDAVGTCRITVNSAEPGTLFLSAKYDATVGDTTGTFTAAATKGWIVIDLPETGNESSGLLRSAALLAAAGVTLLLLARRRGAFILPSPLGH